MSLSLLLLSASACPLYFWRIQKAGSLMLKADVISKMLSAICCNFLLLFLLFTIELLTIIGIPVNNFVFELT